MGWNSLFRVLIAAIAAILFAATTAAAQGRIAEAGWEGFAISGADGRFERCVLYNRTIDALNDSPYDMLGLSQDSAGAVGMLVFYRPSALKRGFNVPVRLKLDQRPAVTTSGDVLSDFHVRVKGPLDAKLTAALPQARTLVVTTQGQAERFALADVGAVLDKLAACVKANQQ
jgi:hypothetical protein